MDTKTPRSMTPFDDLITPDHLQMLKVLIPYTPPVQQQMLAVYEKFMELQSTLTFFQQKKTTLHMQTLGKEKPSFTDILDDMKPFMRGQDADMLQRLSDAMNMLKMFQDLQGTDVFSNMDMMKDMMNMGGMPDMPHTDMPDMADTPDADMSHTTDAPDTDMSHMTDTPDTDMSHMTDTPGEDIPHMTDTPGEDIPHIFQQKGDDSNE